MLDYYDVGIICCLWFLGFALGPSSYSQKNMQGSWISGCELGRGLLEAEFMKESGG